MDFTRVNNELVCICYINYIQGLGTAAIIYCTVNTLHTVCRVSAFWNVCRCSWLHSSCFVTQWHQSWWLRWRTSRLSTLRSQGHRSSRHRQRREYPHDMFSAGPPGKYQNDIPMASIVPYNHSSLLI